MKAKYFLVYGGKRCSCHGERKICFLALKTWEVESKDLKEKIYS